LPVKDGKSAGLPVFVKYGDFEGGVTTAAGGLIHNSVKAGGAWSLYLASLDSNSRPGDWKRLDLHIGNTFGPDRRWSGDSNQIVYIAKDEDTGNTGAEVIHLHTLSTEEDRQVYRAQGSVSCVWAVQQPKLFCSNAGEKTAIFSVAVDSGETACATASGRLQASKN